MKEQILDNIGKNYSEFKQGLYQLSKERIIDNAYRIQFYEFMRESLGEIIKYIDEDKLSILANCGNKLIDRLWDFYCSDITFTFYSWEDRDALVRAFINSGGK